MTTSRVEYTSVCDRCGRGTWFVMEGPCHYSYPKHCKTCGHALEKYAPCPGTLRVVDRSALNPLFASSYENGQRVRVRFGTGPDAEELTGTIDRTTGWRPCYLLMRQSSDTGSMYTIGPDDRIIAVKRGRTYVRTYYPTESTGAA